MYHPVDKINVPEGEPLSITNVIDIISINELLEKDDDIICFSYVPESGLTNNEDRLLEELNIEGFKIDFVLTLNKEKFYIIRKSSDTILM